MKTNSYFDNAAFVRGSMTDNYRQVITNRLLDIINNGNSDSVFKAINTLIDFRQELSFGYKSVTAEDAKEVNVIRKEVSRVKEALETWEDIRKDAEEVKKARGQVVDAMVAAETLVAISKDAERGCLPDYVEKELEAQLKAFDKFQELLKNPKFVAVPNSTITATSVYK